MIAVALIKLARKIHMASLGVKNIGEHWDAEIFMLVGGFNFHGSGQMSSLWDK